VALARNIFVTHNQEDFLRCLHKRKEIYPGFSPNASSTTPFVGVEILNRFCLWKAPAGCSCVRRSVLLREVLRTWCDKFLLIT